MPLMNRDPVGLGTDQPPVVLSPVVPTSPVLVPETPRPEPSHVEMR